jgi:RES domain-containing protein
VSEPLNELVVQRVNDLGSTSWSGTTYRHTSAGRDPLSGVGARMLGGRWNPRDGFPTIYLADPLRTGMLELDRLAEASGTTPQRLISRGYELHTVQVTDLSVLDLRTEAALAAVGLNFDDIADDDRTACQAVGQAAWFLELQGVIAPSASGEGHVLAVFENRAHAGQLTVAATAPLDQATYDAARAA